MKTVSRVTRLLVFMLALSMLLSLFAACQKSGEEAKSTEPKATEDPNYDENGYWKDYVPDHLNYGVTFQLLAAENQKSHFYADEEGTTNVEKAIFSRNSTVEERLGIEIEWQMKRCFSEDEKNDFAKTVETDAMSDRALDGVVTYNLVPYRLADKGLCANLADTPYIDLTQPWWPSEYLDAILYKDQIFTLVDNASVGTLTNLSCIFFNNDMIESAGLESPYDLVKDNKWTIATLRELSKGLYQDSDNDGKKSDKDTYGVCTSTYARVTCWYYGAGVRFSKVNDAGELELIAGDVEKIDAAVQEIASLFQTNDGLINEKSQYVMFEEERVYFYLCVLALCTDMVTKNVEVNYGVAPNPKLNSEQEKYYTHLPNTHDAWFIPSTAENLEMSSALVELMASEAYRQVNEVYFETNLKIRYAPDDRLAQMYDLVRESITFDFIYVYNDVIGGDCNDQIRACIKSPASKNWSTAWGSIKGKVETNFQKVLDAYEAKAE